MKKLHTPSLPQPLDLEATWTYAQKTGELQQDGHHVSTGYSGASDGKNNPTMENVPNVGPIPRGDWTISGPPSDSKDHGPYVLRLNPEASTPHARPRRLPDARRLQGASRQRFSWMCHSAESRARGSLEQRRQRIGGGCGNSRSREFPEQIAT